MTQHVRKGYRNHRRATWAGALLALAAVALVVLVPAGSAKAPSSEIKKYDACLQYSNSPPCSPTGAKTILPGGSSIQLTLTLKNQQTSNQTLGSVNLTAPSGSGIQVDNTKPVTVSPLGNADPNPPTSSTIQIRNLSLAPNSSATVSFWVNTDCSGSTGLNWTIGAKQSNTFLGTGNDFTLVNSTGLSTNLQGCSYIDFVPGAQPTKTVVGATITGSEYSSGGPVQVGLYNNVTHELLSSCPASGGTITISKTPSATGTLHGTLSQALADTGSSCVASFNDLSIGDLGGSGQPTLPQSFQLLASGAGSSATSTSFDIINGTTCTSGQSCSTTLTTQSTLSTSSQTSGNFVFIGMESAGALLGTRIPAGCEGFQSVGADPIFVSEQRTSASGEIFVTYGIKKTLIKKKYSDNSGQQFIPICAGAKRIEDVGGKTHAVDCDEDYKGYSQAGWWGKKLDPLTGNFTTDLAQAVCDPATGFFFGIMGSFQDYTSSDPTKIIDPNTSPTVTEWTSDTTYRYFTSRWPSKSGIGVPFDTAPWDGVKMG